MSHTEVIQVKVRAASGSRNARRLRAEGQIPAVLYGHGEATVSLALPLQKIEAFLRHGGKVVQLQGDVSESALIRDVQWDSLGGELLHVDLARVSSGEVVETSVPIELRGTAPGTREGGILEHMLHELEIRCPVGNLPEKLSVSINALGLGQAITVGDLEWPSGATTAVESREVVVHCVAPVELPEEEAAVPGAAEPELIGRREASSEEGNGEG